MIPLRAVIDTNLVVSAALRPGRPSAPVLLLALTKPARLYVSEAILAEYREVLARPELKTRKGLQLLDLIKTRVLGTPAPSCERPRRRQVLECADAPGPTTW